MARNDSADRYAPPATPHRYLRALCAIYITVNRTAYTELDSPACHCSVSTVRRLPEFLLEVRACPTSPSGFGAGPAFCLSPVAEAVPKPDPTSSDECSAHSDQMRQHS